MTVHPDHFWTLINERNSKKWNRVFGFMAIFTIGSLYYMYNVRSRCEDGAEIPEKYIRNRLNESEEIWKNGVTIRHKTEVKRPEAVKLPWSGSHATLIWDFFYPTFNCPHSVERLGRVGDGGKWVCGVNHLKNSNSKEKSCVVYSYGVAEDTSFEEDILARTFCTLRAFDHTVESKNVDVIKFYPTRSSFEQIGLGVNDSKIGPMRTLKSAMDNHGHRFIDILKVDVEGGEFKLFPQILKDFPNGFPFGQLLIEIHLNFPDESLYLELKNWWEMLEGAGLRPFRSEPNLYDAKNNKNPACFEFSFLNVKVDHVLLHA